MYILRRLLSEVMREVKPLLVMLTYRSQGGEPPEELTKLIKQETPLMSLFMSLFNGLR